MIRYVFFFRNYIDKNKILDLIKNISTLFRTKEESFRRACYYTVENLIIMKEIQNPFQQSNYMFNVHNPQIRNALLDNFGILLQTIFVDIQNTPLLEAYEVRALYNTIKVLDNACVEFIDAFGELFKIMIQKIYDVYDFNSIYVVFDALATLMIQIRESGQAVSKFVSVIFPVLNEIIVKKHYDLMSYVFQIYALAIHFYSIQSQDQQVFYEGSLLIYRLFPLFSSV